MTAPLSLVFPSGHQRHCRKRQDFIFIKKANVKLLMGYLKLQTQPNTTHFMKIFWFIDLYLLIFYVSYSFRSRVLFNFSCTHVSFGIKINTDMLCLFEGRTKTIRVCSMNPQISLQIMCSLPGVPAASVWQVEGWRLHFPEFPPGGVLIAPRLWRPTEPSASPSAPDPNAHSSER